MADNRLPTSFSSLMGYGNPAMNNQYTGQQDWTSTLTPTLAGVDVAGTSGAVNATGGWGAGIGDWFKDSGFFGSTAADGAKTQGWGGTALGVGQGIANLYMGMKQYGLAKDQLAFSKDQFNKNYAAQQKTINAQMQDRQAARVASNPGAYQSVGDYMKQNGI
jgi:hypothetical protein